MIDFSLTKYIVLTQVADKYNSFETYTPVVDMERATYEADAHVSAYSNMPDIKATAFIFETKLLLTRTQESADNAEN